MPDLPLVKRPGVYCFTNTVNSKRYVGSSVRSVRGRVLEHIRLLKRGIHKNPYFQRAWNSYGLSAFTFKAILYCNPEECLGLEQKYLDLYKSANPKFGYNLSPTAGNSNGVRLSIETRTKLSKARKGKKHSPSHVANRAASRRAGGIKWTEEMKQRMREKKLGTKASEETKAKMSAAHAGRIMPAESIEKTAAWHRGKKRSKESVDRMKAAQQKRLSEINILRNELGQIVSIERKQ